MEYVSTLTPRPDKKSKCFNIKSNEILPSIYNNSNGMSSGMNSGMNGGSFNNGYNHNITFGTFNFGLNIDSTINNESHGGLNNNGINSLNTSSTAGNNSNINFTWFNPTNCSSTTNMASKSNTFNFTNQNHLNDKFTISSYSSSPNNSYTFMEYDQIHLPSIKTYIHSPISLPSSSSSMKYDINNTDLSSAMTICSTPNSDTKSIIIDYTPQLPSILSPKPRLMSPRIRNLSITSPLAESSLNNRNKMPLKKSNSTSTVLSTSSLSDPDVNELILAVSIVLHLRLLQDAEKIEDAEIRLKYNYFDQPIENFNDLSAYQSPPLEFIYEFLKAMSECTKYSPECNIIALVFINRFIQFSGYPFHGLNWRPLLVTSLLIAQKIWDDRSLMSTHFSLILPLFTTEMLNNFEGKFLELLEFDISLSTRVYAKYYFELRTLCEEQRHQTFPLGPINNKVAIELENRSKNIELLQQTGTLTNMVRSSTSSNLAPPRKKSIVLF